MSDDAEGPQKNKGRCECGNPGQKPHPCPYAVEILHDDETLCVCCEDCEYQCCMDT